METYGHEAYREMYSCIASALDNVTPMTFQDFINSPVDDIYDMYSKYKLDNLSYTEWCQALQNIHDFGDALVLMIDNINTDYVITKEMLNLFIEQDRDVMVNLKGERYCTYLSVNSVNIQFGNSNKSYKCLSVKHISDNVGCNFHIPINVETTRIFMSGCSICADCNKKCIHPKGSSVSQMNYFYNGILSIRNCDTIRDIHKSNCEPFELFKRDVMLIYNALLRYKDNSSKSSVKHNKIHTPNSGGTNSCTQSHNAYDNESIVYKKSEVSEYQGGHHNSPIVHYVDGYWRKKSKKDDTLIFVKGFARGGTEEERKNFDVKLKKQKVYKV